ncbi:penicillin-binding protein 1A [Porphyrobacter sp. GA68]|uniref:penicillin-binding protein 1A n=1 Tax=Porphyrobacter sp. GA68 TaxID=2883480 RepID=UPI001D196C55|nr:transglycosylase domain-containing protein [Porphyrobacter sp. GA68]
MSEIALRIRNGFGASAGWLADRWRSSRLLRWATICATVVLVLLTALWLVLVRDLPDARKLADYQPALPTVVRGIDGEIVHRFERERRVQLQYADFPPGLIEAFLAAEDKTFFSHGGVDYPAFAKAVVNYGVSLGSGGDRVAGGSTITQQVAKNLLLSNEYSVTRKMKEILLARRIESVLTKQQILEIYLNEIPLGRRSFGVQAAARAYFDKDVDQLDLKEMAFLAILPKAPETYSRERFEDRALGRRNFVLAQMANNNFITAAEARSAQAQPLGLIKERPRERFADAGYFLETVRRELMDRYGEQAEDGPNSVYGGGLWVRTSLDTDLQDAARDSLRSGLLRYHQGKGWTGPIATLNPDNGNLTGQLASSNLGINYKDWRVGVVTRAGHGAEIGFANGRTFPLANAPDGLRVGDVVAASPQGNGFRLQVVPEVSGGFLAEQPYYGRILAMQGGFDSRLGDFNRATQANRQPGSTIKPFVYATGLDNGLTPASEIPDQPFCFYQGAGLGEKCFRNFDRSGGGVHTMRWGLEQSRNLMTVHIANDAGMQNVTRTFANLGIGQYEAYPSFALGAGDTTVERMVNAYATLVNQGRLQRPSTIDYVQDRNGKVIWRSDNRECRGCRMAQWDGAPMPRFGLRGKQVMDPRTAYQVVHMLEGVVERGTATVLRDLNLPLFGKTGTTNGPTNAWFIGGSADIVAGVYLGFDQPRPMGGWVQGGRVAAPIFKDFVQKTRTHWSNEPVIAPPGVRMVRIDRRSGRRVFDAWPTDDPRAAVIWEAFKPDSEPPIATRQSQIAARREEMLELIRLARNGVAQQQSSQQRQSVTAVGEAGDFVEEQGGLY